MLHLTTDLPTPNVELRHVEGDRPHTVGHTVTSNRTRLGGPELIVHTDDHDLARSVLWELTSPTPTAANLLQPLDRRALDCLDGREVAFRRVDDVWTTRTNIFARSGSWCTDHLSGHGALQVVLPDEEGRLPGEGGRPATCSCCPDLSLPGWRRYAQPFWPEDATWHTPLPPHEAAEDGMLVAADIYLDGAEHDGRVELVPVQRLGERTVRVLAPPALADWTTTGAVHVLDEPGIFSDLPVLGEPLEPGPNAHVCWALLSTGDTNQVAGAISLITDRLRTLANVSFTATSQWLSVATPVATAGEVADVLAQLVRAGQAYPAKRYSDPIHGWQCSDARCNCQRRRWDG